MRTTLTLEDDVAAGLRELVTAGGGSFKDVVNHVLRLGLSAAGQQQQPERYHIEPVHLGQPRYPNLDDIGEILLVAEGDDQP